jgi:IS30 family transposase
MPTYQRLLDHERERISQMRVNNNSLTLIALELGRSVSTISREIKRNSSKGEYLAFRAQQRAQERQRYSHACKPKIENNQELRTLIHTKLAKRWSPTQISEWLLKTHSMHISHETIYQYIYVQTKGELKKELIGYLRQQKPKRQSRKLERTKRGSIPDLISIHQRPAEVADRSIPGHWEGDLIIGKDHQSAIGSLVERSTRYVLITKLKAKDALTVRKAFAKTLQQLPECLKKTMTYDRGTEMAEHKQFTIDTKIKVFFCDPHSPWQRGTNENTNGLIRDFLPKGTDFNKVSARKLKWIQDALNERPRKTLDWDTPKDKLDQLLLHS